VRLTGERPLEGATPDSLLAFHDAGYREVIARLGTGRVLDVGCGMGDETVRLAGANREVVGVDYSPETALDAASSFGGADQWFLAMDGSELGFAPKAFDAVCSSHIIEHLSAPEAHVAELARVLRPDGDAFVITPNRPADFENPFHVYLFEPPELDSLLRVFFDEVEVLGLEGSTQLHADFAARRASGERLLRLDVLGLRKKLPRSWYVFGYERALPIVYDLLGTDRTGIGSGIDASHFFVTDSIESTTPGLFAIARSPRR